MLLSACWCVCFCFSAFAQYAKGEMETARHGLDCCKNVYLMPESGLSSTWFVLLVLLALLALSIGASFMLRKVSTH